MASRNSLLHPEPTPDGGCEKVNRAGVNPRLPKRWGQLLMQFLNRELFATDPSLHPRRIGKKSDSVR